MSYILDSIPQMLLMLPVVLFSLSVHEAAHGFVAYKLGDPTARNLGRLTLNPMKHINPIGFFAMLLFRVGWANPVPINTRYFKNPKLQHKKANPKNPPLHRFSKIQHRIPNYLPQSG